MRVTNNMMTMNLLLNVNRNLAKMSNMQDQLATGKRIHRPSDDPVLASKVLARKTDLAELAQYERNTRDALGWMDVTEKALEDNGTVFQRIRELTVQAANGVNTPDDTKNISEEIKNLREQLIANANTTFAGRYIFSGFETDKPLLTKEGSFNIDIDEYTLNNKPIVKYEVSVGEAIDVMTSGLDIYGSVPETNFMIDTIPSGSDIGTGSSKESVAGNFNFNLDYTVGHDLDVTIGGVLYPVDESTLNGGVYPLTKEDVVDVYNTALGVNGTAYFNASDELVIESDTYGPGLPVMSVGVSAGFTPAYTAGVATTEATLNNGLNNFVDPLTTEDRDVLRDNGLSIVVNGVVRNIKPDGTIPSGFTVAQYAAHMDAKADVAFGSDVVDITVDAFDNLQFTTKNTPDSTVPEISVDFPRVHESQLIADVTELYDYMVSGDTEAIGNMLDTIDGHMNNMLALRADIGARSNRLDMISKKIAANNISFTQLLSDAQDADMSEVIMLLKNAENVYQASLSTGARIIQPSLVDFLR